MTDPVSTQPRASRLAKRLAELTDGQVDQLILLIGAILITLAVAAVDWRAGLFVAGAMLIADVVLGRLLQRRSRP